MNCNNCNKEIKEEDKEILRRVKFYLASKETGKKRE